MSNSKLISCTILSPNNSGKRCYPLTRITPHCMVGQMSARACGNLFARSSYQASSNYGIGKDGEIGLYVPEDTRSWCSSSADNDNRAITIECASNTYHPYSMNSKVYASLINLCVDICRRYGKDTLLWFGDKSTSLNYKPKENELVLTVHRWFAAKSCPGDWLYNRLGDLAQEVTKKLKESATEEEKTAEQPNTAASSLINNEESDRERIIWNFFAGKGLNHYAIAGLMGNLYAESALRPNNLQNVFERKLGMTDKGYTEAVNNGSYTNCIHDFIHDGAGYGLAQWTFWSRKKALYEYAKSQGKPIDNLNMQLEFLWSEIQRYSRSMAALTAGKSIRAVSDAILTDYVKPADQSNKVKAKREKFGREIYDRQTGSAAETPKKGAYAVQAGAFSNQKNAKNRAKSLTEKGFAAEVVQSGSLYKVICGKYGTVAEAAEVRQELGECRINAVIVEV